jgi:SPP1 gp7 family putative phage head morphogenesis protein
MPTKTPIDQGVISRVVQGAKYMLTGVKPDNWMSPGQPVAPQAQEEAKGRQFDFPVGVNTRYRPRDQEAVSFEHMRALADGYDLLRLVIETRKDQLAKLKWTIAPRDEKAQSDKRCEDIVNFMQFPDGELDWDTWLRALLEDLLVCDAATVYPRPTLDGSLFAVELVDGATIKRVLDITGRTPVAPDPAYQQIIKGIPAVNYTRDELIYKPRNVRTNRVYGYSPVEQVIMTVNIAMRRQLHQLQYYTEGNVPEMIYGVPPEWNTDQIKKFQDYWDAMLEGNTAERRHAKFAPGGIKPIMTKEAALKDDYDEWLARIVCFAFSIAPNALVKQVNRATAESVRGAALSEGLIPLMKWVENLINLIVWKYFGYQDLCFKWVEEDETSPLVQMQTLTGYVNAKVITKDEARESIGKEPMTDEQRDELSPPAPAMGEDGLPVDPADPDAEPPAPKGKKPADKAEDDKAGKYLGKAMRRRVVPIDRERTKAARTVTKLSKLFKGAFGKIGDRVAAELADKVGKADTPDKDLEELLAQLTFEELEDLVPSVTDVLASMHLDGSKEAFLQVTGSFSKEQLELANEKAIAYAEERAAELVTKVSDSTRDMLRSDVAQAMEEGSSNQDLADTIAQNYGFSDERSMVIARTETAYADVAGNLQAYRESGVVEGKKWITGDGCCDECQELDGVIVPLDEQFDGGVDGAPLHPNCRCDVLPVLGDD